MADKLMKKCSFSLQISKIQTNAQWEAKTIKPREENIRKIFVISGRQKNILDRVQKAQTIKKLINWTSSKLKASLQKILLWK